MEDLRDGFFTEKQEKKIDELIELNGISEKFDGVAIRLLDNKGLEALKPKLIEKWGPEVLPDIYEVIDLLFESLEAITKD